MTKLQIAAVAAALGLGVLAQIPEHDHDAMAGHNHTAMDSGDEMLAATSSMPVGLHSARYNVTGMT